MLNMHVNVYIYKYICVFIYLVIYIRTRTQAEFEFKIRNSGIQKEHCSQQPVGSSASCPPAALRRRHASILCHPCPNALKTKGCHGTLILLEDLGVLGANLGIPGDDKEAIGVPLEE